MKLKIGQKIECKQNGLICEITNLDNGIVTVDHDGKDNQIPEDLLILHIEEGNYSIVD